MFRDSISDQFPRSVGDRWQIEAGLCAGKGRVRKIQEDAWYFGNEKNSPINEDCVQKTLCMPANARGCLFAVFDGVGEGMNGQKAAWAAADWMKYVARLSDRGLDLNKILPEWIPVLNRRILRDFPGAGTTMALARFSGRFVQIAHIGDCRVYRIHTGTPEQLTRDHTHAELMLRSGLITPQEALIHPSRNVLSRYLGMENEAIGSAVEISRPFPLEGKDRYILCTDGVYDMIPEEVLNSLASETGSAACCAELLYRQALAEGGRDNLTVIVCEVQCGS